MRSQLFTVIGGILLSGVLLKVAGDGYLGDSVKKAAQFITSGYGV